MKNLEYKTLNDKLNENNNDKNNINRKYRIIFIIKFNYIILLQIYQLYWMENLIK